MWYTQRANTSKDLTLCFDNLQSVSTLDIGLTVLTVAIYLVDGR